MRGTKCKQPHQCKRVAQNANPQLGISKCTLSPSERERHNPSTPRLTMSLVREQLGSYYCNSFPVREIFTWLHKGREAEAVRREFVFVSRSGIFSRNIRFSTELEFRDMLMQQVPSRIDVGPQFNTLCRPGDEWIAVSNAYNSKQVQHYAESVRTQEWNDKQLAMKYASILHSESTRQWTPNQVRQTESKIRVLDPNIMHVPIRRELVFDIDLTDYDDVRVCCQGKVVCAKCWILVYAAVLVLEDTLRNKLNFKHLLWVYSGRRGVHCWVSDEEAMVLNDTQRESIVNGFLQRPSILGYQSQNQHCHEHLARAYALLVPVYEQKWLPAQHGLKYTDFAEYLDPRIRPHFQPSSDGQVALQRYFEFVHQINRFILSPELRSRPGAYSIRDCRLRMVMQTLFPRIDRQVTVKMGHLLKLPFCVHPDTKQLCLPFSIDSYENVMEARNSPKLEDLQDKYSEWNVMQNKFRASSDLMGNHSSAIRMGLFQQQIETVRPAVMPPKAPTSPMQRLERAFASDGFSLRD